MKSFSLAVLFAGALSAPFTLFSADEPTALDPITTTATRSEALLSQLSASVQVITRADIERAQANDLSDLLRSVAGLDVVRAGGPGSAASVFTRGTESNHTLFLVDGVRYTTETFLNAQIQNLAPELIERIEIVKGPRSALWGSDAIGGVVQIITRRAASGLHGSLALRGGSYGTQDASAFLGGAGENGELSLNLQAQDFDGYPPQRNGTEDRGHDALNGNLQGRLKLGAGALAARHLQAEGTNEYVDFGGASRSQDYSNRVSSLELGLPVTGGWSTRLIASLAHDNLTQREPDDPARPGTFSETEVERHGVEWINDLVLGSVKLVGGLAASRSEIDSVFVSSFGDSVTQDSTERHAVFAQGQWAGETVDLLLALRGTDHDQFGSATTGNLDLGVAAWSGARLGLAAGTGFKEPELTDLFGSFGNPALEPERSRSYELNLRQTLGAHQVLTLAAFDNQVDDLISFDNTTFQLVNIARTRTHGVEAAWEYRDAAWSARLSGNVQEPRDETSGQRLPRRSGKSLQAALSRQLGPVSLSLETLAHGRRLDVGGVELGGYAVVNAGLGWTLSPAFSLALRGENLLDKDYQLIDGFRTPERSGYLTLRYGF